MDGLPTGAFQATCAHEFGHVWLNEHLTLDRKAHLGREANEGFCELLSYLWSDSQHDERQKSLILRNLYTRGQIQLFVDAERRFGFNDVLEWMVHGTDSYLDASDPNRVRRVEGPRQPVATHGLPAYAAAAAAAPPPALPSTLVLKAVFWDPKRPLAVINDQTLGLHEEGRVHLASTNLTVRCVAIRPNSVRLRVGDSPQEQELMLSAR